MSTKVDFSKPELFGGDLTAYGDCEHCGKGPRPLVYCMVVYGFDLPEMREDYEAWCKECIDAHQG